MESKYIETELRAESGDILEGGGNSPLFEKFVYSVSTRVARDLMALLPVKKVVLHVVNNGTTFFSSIVDNSEFARYDFKREPLRTIVRRMDFVSGIKLHQIHEVKRKSLS